MELVTENFHPAFFNPQGADVMKCVLEFDMTDPEQAKAHYNALAGSRYRELLTSLVAVLNKEVKEHHGKPEAFGFNRALDLINDDSIALDVKVFRE